jgi:16S rRNA (adenine1518-N6/adenine1519-N6)-dimethyltransferase
MQGHQARRRFGQNFLHDARVVARIVAAIDPRPGDRIVEIGPGLGALTAPLIEAAGLIIAVEIDRDLAARLRGRYGIERLDLIEGDALALDWAALATATGQGGLRIVGNLPYNISTPLLFALAGAADHVRDQHFMLQKEVVDRMVALPGSKTYGRLSVMLQVRYAVERLFDVPAGAFSPAPKVASSVVRLTPHDVARRAAVDAGIFAGVVTAAFGQRRKTLRNALAHWVDAPAFEVAGIDPGARAETLGVEAFVRLATVARANPPAR